MGPSIRVRTLQAAIVTVAVIHLVGIAEIVLTGWEVSTLTGYGITAVFAISVVVALLAGRWATVRGCAMGVVYYAGFQTAAFWFTTPTPPTQGELIIGTLEGLGLLLVVVFLTRWTNAAERAHKMSHDAGTVDEGV